MSLLTLFGCRPAKSDPQQAGPSELVARPYTDQFRCTQCGKMQKPGEPIVYVPDSIRITDSRDDVVEACRAGRYNGGRSGWCLKCASKWGQLKVTVPKHTWPDTDPPDNTDPYLKFDINMSLNGTPYQKKEVSPGRWQWVVDQESVDLQRQADRHRHELADALVSRVLTDPEMAEVGRMGSDLIVQYGVSYNPQEVELRFQTMLLTQQTIRAGKK